MLTHKPIHTEQARCQDCYKCLRGCHLKAIRIERERAAVIPDRCVYCGACVTTCPVNAKKVRSDRVLARHHLRHREEVWASLAPSWVAEFPGVAPGQMVGALQKLGFSGASETALGAEEVSRATADHLVRAGRGLHIATACPSVVELVQRHLPALTPRLLPLVSPMQAHGHLLRTLRGEHTGVVFFGPCVAKKLESDAPGGPVDAALTFAELRDWFADEGIDPRVEAVAEGFFPGPAADGGKYPLDGGMIQTVRTRLGTEVPLRTLHFSGLGNVLDALEGLEEVDPEQPLLLELLACEGGCLNGPGMTRRCGTTLKAMAVLDGVGSGTPSARLEGATLHAEHRAEPLPVVAHDESDLARALHRVGKTSPDDELNCGGCGYDSCQSLAAALLEGRAEEGMCVSHMRKLASSKANALLRAMPAGVVLVDEKQTIVECNRRFADLMGEEAQTIFEAMPGMEGASLRKVAPDLFEPFAEVLAGEAEARTRNLRTPDAVLQVQVFAIEPGRLACAVLQDITEPAIQREQIIHKAQDVIRKNVATVQQIAYLLGENAAESEMILNSIVESFRVDGAQGEP